MQNARLCDLGILLAYPCGSVELMAPQVSRKRFFGKKPSMSYIADQTFTTAVTSTDTGTPVLVYLSYLLPPLSPLPYRLRSEAQTPVYGQTTAQRSETQLPRMDHGSGLVDHVGFERQSVVERRVEGNVWWIARNVGNGARTHDVECREEEKGKNSGFQLEKA